MRPGQHVVGRELGLGNRGGIKPQLLGGAGPRLFIEKLRPGVESGAAPPGGLHPIGHLAAAAAHDRLDERRRGVVVVHVHRLVLHRALEQSHAPQRLLRGNLAVPLEGRLGLGHEHRAGHAHAHAAALLGRHGGLGAVVGALGQTRDALDVVVGLGGQPHHEIQLAAAPAGGESGIDGGEQVVLGDVLVDDVAQPLGAGLRRERETALLLAGHELGHLHPEGVQALGGHAHAHAGPGAVGVHPREDLGDLRVMRGGERRQAHLVVAGLGEAPGHGVHDVVG